MLLFPPDKKGTDMADAKHMPDAEQREKFYAKWATDYVASGKTIKDEGAEIAYAYHRLTGEVRPFNLSPKYPARTSVAGALWEGQWRLASEKEIEEHHKKMQAMRVEAAKKMLNTQIAASQVQAQSAVFAQAVEVLAKDAEANAIKPELVTNKGK